MTVTNDIPRDQARELEGLLAALVHWFQVDEEQVCCRDVTLSEYRALNEMSERCTPAMQDLAEALRLTRSGATRVVDRLEQKRLARRERDATDGRVCCVRLTADGERLLAGIHEDTVRHMRDLLGEIDPARRRETLDALRRLTEAARNVARR